MLYLRYKIRFCALSIDWKAAGWFFNLIIQNLISQFFLKAQLDYRQFIITLVLGGEA